MKLAEDSENWYENISGNLELADEMIQYFEQLSQFCTEGNPLNQNKSNQHK